MFNVFFVKLILIKREFSFEYNITCYKEDVCVCVFFLSLDFTLNLIPFAVYDIKNRSKDPYVLISSKVIHRESENPKWLVFVTRSPYTLNLTISPKKKNNFSSRLR